MQNRNMLIVGITGGMGCGQTTLAKFLEKQGAKIIYADEIAHKVVNQDPEVKKKLKRAFGRDVYSRSGKLKRKLIAKIIFNDENKTRLLNRIVHPPLIGWIIEEMEKARESGKHHIIGIDAALIFESHIEKVFDVNVVVTSKMLNRINRIQRRDGLTQKEVQNRIRKQIPIDEKARWADFVIRNDDSITTLESNAKQLFKELEKISKRYKRYYQRSTPVYIKVSK